MVDDNADVEESDEVKKERNKMQECLILSFVDRTGIAKKNLELYNKAFESWSKHKNKASSKNHQRRKSNFKYSWLTYQDRLQDPFRKTSLHQNMVFVMNVPRWRRKILCACIAVSAFTLFLTVAASMAIS
jgi:hypothetical protein